MLTHILSHLPPSSLSDVSFVSRRFHELVTTPHAWRIAFSRFFPGTEALSLLESNSKTSGEDYDIHSETRLFTRLTALASWRSEYIIRTRLLRSLSRGKPADAPSAGASSNARIGNSATASAQVTYDSDLVTVVDRLHAIFGSGSTKRLPRFIHGATDVGMASSSDPRTGKVDAWGFADVFTPQHFIDVYPGHALYGSGPGNVVGVPNSMDVSQPYGMVYVEGSPNGRIYYRSTEEKRGRFLSPPMELTIPVLGIPAILSTEALTATWIAKSTTLPELSKGLVGILVGSSQGTLSLHSLGTNPLRERRMERSELTARWVLSPGVPIIAIAIDENYSVRRQSSKRFWAVVLNALGELFYLTNFPTRQYIDRAQKLDDLALERIAWETGRTVAWKMVKPSLRKAKRNPFDDFKSDGIDISRLPWNGQALTEKQLVEETREINALLQKHPEYFRKLYDGWDMRRRLEVDFAASDENDVGEHIVVFSCALDEDQHAGIKRYTRCLIDSASEKPSTQSARHSAVLSSTAGGTTAISQSSSFEEDPRIAEQQPTWSFGDAASKRQSSIVSADPGTSIDWIEEWQTSNLLLTGLKSPQITTTAIDCSNFSLLSSVEDPLLSMTGSSFVSLPMSSPGSQKPFPSSSIDIPGQRARLLGIGTNAGIILLWNIRAPTSNNLTIESNVKPIRMIHTDSPQISCLALTALYLVHGGNDGLVQAWDPLASQNDPIRTLNSRFSSRARRRLVQAQTSPAGVGINLFAAGAICLDPDPTVLRGMVSLGSHLRYWSYSSQTAEQYKCKERRLRRSERSSNQGGNNFSGSGREALKDYIANEKLELEREKRLKRKEDNKLSSRYGVDLLGPGATEDEVLAYATLLSEETAKDDEQRRKSASEGSTSDTVTEEAIAASPVSSVQDDLDSNMAEAIRLSLQDSHGFRASSLGDGDASASSFTMRYAKNKKQSPSPLRTSKLESSPKPSTAEATSVPAAEVDDLEFAIRLSQAEEESRAEGNASQGKTKGKARAL